MKKISIIFMVLLSLATIVSAVPSNPEYECSHYCATPTAPIAKWTPGDEGLIIYNHDFDSLNVDGNEDSASWTSDLSIQCVLEKESTGHFNETTGTSGTVNKHRHDISHITFCGVKETNVPEFGLIAGSLAIAGAGAGYLFLRRKN